MLLRNEYNTLKCYSINKTKKNSSKAHDSQSLSDRLNEWETRARDSARPSPQCPTALAAEQESGSLPGKVHPDCGWKRWAVWLLMDGGYWSSDCLALPNINTFYSFSLSGLPDSTVVCFKRLRMWCQADYASKNSSTLKIYIYSFFLGCALSFT